MMAPSRRQLVGLAAGLGVAGMAGLWAIRAGRAWMQPPAPQTRFELINGQVLQTQDWRGQPVVVNFWATSCVTCVAEMPHWTQLYRAYQARGLRMLAVAMQYDSLDHVRSYTRSRQLPFPVAYDRSGDAARLWGGVQATPTTLLVDRQGHIIQRMVGRADFARLHARIQAELDAS